MAKHPLLTIHSLGQLQGAEAEIVRLLAETPVISQLFLLDPVRALADVGVSLSPEAVREWEAVAPALRQRPGAADPGRYDRVKAIGGAVGLKVAIHSLLAPPAVNAMLADDEIVRTFTGRGTAANASGGKL